MPTGRYAYMKEKTKKTTKKATARVKFSIRKKLVMTLVPIVGFVFVVVMALIIARSQNTVKDRTYALMEEQGSKYAGQLQAVVDRVLAEGEVFHGTLENMQGTDEDIEHYMEYAMTVDPMMPSGIYVGDKNGKYIDITWTPDPGYVPAERDWYKTGVTQSAMTFGEAYIDSDSGQLCVSASAKLAYRGDDNAVVAMDVFLGDISNYVKEYKVLDNGECYLVNLAGDEPTVLASKDDAVLGKTLAELGKDSAIGQAADVAKAADQKIHTLKAGGKNYVVSAQEMEKVDWVLLAVAPEKDISKTATELRTMAVISVLVALILVAAVIIILVTRITKPIQKLSENIHRMADGDFTVKIEAKGTDEIGFMGNQLDGLVESMRDIFTEIGGVSTKLAGQADSSSNVSGELKSSAQSQSQSMKELNQTVEELVTSISEVANNATALAQTVAETGNKGKNASQKMEETVASTAEGKRGMDKIQVAMGEIAEAVSSLETVVTQVGDSTAEIAKFVEIIGGIASQTNLLSLNAAIEAARAGEAGKGFAVVAGEVRDLADNSTSAVAEISQITTAINDQVNNTVKQTRDSVTRIKESVKLVEEVSEAFDLIYNNINETSTLVQDMVEDVKAVDEVATSVAAITEQQSASTEEILATAENLAELAGNVSDNSENVANEAESIADTADLLSERLKGFKVE